MSERREIRRQRLQQQQRDAAKRATPPHPPPGSAGTRAARLQIPAHALGALEYQAHRFYRRWHLAQAEAIARRVLHLDPRRVRAWQVLGDIAMRRADWAQAFENFETALGHAPQDPILQCRAAEALFWLGQYERAERWFARVLSLDSPAARGAARRARGFLDFHAEVFRRAQNPEGENPTQALSEDELRAALAARAKAPPASQRRTARSQRMSRH